MTDVLKIKTRYDLPVGTLFTVDNDETVLRVEPSDGSKWRCVGCYFMSRCQYYEAYINETVLCHAYTREDKQDVIFRKIEEEDEEQ